MLQKNSEFTQSYKKFNICVLIIVKINSSLGDLILEFLELYSSSNPREMKNIRIPIKYGVAIAAALIAYFLILSIFGAHKNPVFSLFNGVIMAFGMYESIKHYRSDKGSKFKYQKGFMSGLLTGFNATIIFTIFFGIYSTELNPGFLDELLTMWRSDYNAGVGIILFVVGIMGFATSFVLTLAFMQLFKDSWNTVEGNKHTLGN